MVAADSGRYVRVWIVTPGAIMPLVRVPARGPPRWMSPPEGAGLGETLEVSAGLAETLTETLDVADEEVAPDKTVEVDTTGDDVAAGVGVGDSEATPRPGARVHRVARPR